MTTQKKRFGKKTLALLMALVMVLGTLPLGVLASERTLELVVGESAQLMGSTSENGQEEWTAEDASVVHVSENGLVTALTGGKTTVTHTYYIETASAPVPETAAPAEEAPAQPEGAVVEISAPEQEIVLDGGEKTLVHSDPAETPAAEESEETSAEPPVVTVPEVTEPEATEPEATEPEATEPEVTEPEVTEPEATEPEATEPEAAEPEAAEPEATEPEVTEPEATEPEVTEPEATEPEVTEPEAAQPAVEYIRQTERWTVTVSEVLTGTAVNDGTRILVSAPKDAFPENTELVITPVVKDEMNQLLDFVDGVLGTMLTAGTMDLEDWDPEELIRGLLMELDGSITAEEPMTAFDVSFLSPDGEKLQPAEGKTVTVTFDQEGAEDLRVYHVTEDGQAEAVETVLVDGKAQIQADAFSIYAVVGGVRQSGNSVTIQVGDSAALKHSEEHDDERSYQWSVSHRSGLKLGKPSRDGKSIEVTGQKPGTYTVTLKYQYYDGWIFGSWKNASETFTVTVAEERLPSEELTTVPTVDSTALGVDMYMFNYDGQPFGGHEWTQDNRGIKQGFIGRTTQSDGFPRVETSNGTRSLNNWFNTSEGSRANHLFLQAAYEEDGSFYYDSMENFAQLDGREFTVYDQIGTPNFEQGQSQGTTPNIYNVGNFMPYNTLDPDRTFQGASEKPVHALKEEADYYFGMYVNANFFQPEGGQVKNQDMVFEFTGDDDLWVYIDGVLVLDLGGCHDAADGSINFATGAVYAEGGKRTTIRDQFRAANQAGRAENWNGNTFADFTGHRIQIFYMERGAGASNLKIRFNIPTVPAGSVMVTKDLKGLNPAQAKTREFTMELTRNGSPLAGAAYTIAGTDVTGVTDSQGRFPLRDGQSAIFSGLEKNSTVRIREVDVDTGLFSVKYNGRTTDGVELTVPVGNGSVAATVTNTVKSGRTADLTVTKQFRSGSAPMAAAPDGFRASFELRAEDGTVVATVPYSQFVNGRYTFKDLLKGSYTVTESIEAAGAYGESTYKKTTANGETANAVTIHAGEAADFVNVYGPDTQDVTFTKTWAGHRSKTVSSIAVEITGGGTTVSGTIDGASGTIDGYDYTVSGWGTDSWSVTVQALPALESGSYAIRETAVNGVAVSGGAADAESGKWTVSQSGDALTNTYDAYDKSDIDNDVTIRIHKTNGVGALSGAKFQIYTGHFTGQPGSGNRAVGSVSAATNSRGLTTLTLKASQLPTGAYTLYEATVPAGYQRAENVPFTVTQTVESRSSEDGGHVIHTGRHISAVTTLPATVEVVDAAITGTLTVKKTVTGTTEANGPFTITVSGTSVTGAKVEEVLTLKANESKSLSLPYGQYTITETNPGDTANDRFIGVTYTGTGVAVAEDGSFDFHPAQNGAAAVEAVNAYEVKKDGQLSITKEVIWDSTKSQTPPSDAEFEFHVDKNREAYGNASFTVDGQTRTTDDKGNFTLKDGETAVFTGLTYRDQFWITENAGRAPGFVYDTGRCLYTVSSTPGSHTFHNSYFKSVPFNGDGDLTVSKVWDGDGVKPESITVQLKQNGQNYGDPVTLTGPNWNHTFENLPEYDQTDAHEAYRYTVEETAMTFGEAYTVAPHQSGFLVSRAAENNGKHEALGVWMPSGSLESGTWAQTNAWFPADNTGSIVVQKTDDATGAALPGAVFTLTGDGYRQEQTTNSDGLATFTGLKPGTYTLTETTAPDGYLSNEPSRQVIIEKDRSEHVLVEVKAPSSGNLFTNLWNWFVKKSDSSEYVHQLTITNRKDVDPTPEIPEITVANGGSFALTKQDDAGVMLDGVSFTLSYGDTELRTGTTANGVLHMDLTSQQLSALETALEKANVPFRGGEPVTLTVTETPKAGYETAEPFDVTMTCTVTLSDAPVDGKFVETHSWRVTGVEGGTASAVTVTNARTTGTLELNKTVTGISGEQADRPFTFTLTGTDVSG